MSQSASKLTSSIFSTLLLGVFALWALTPFFFLLISSFKPGQEMIRNGLQFKFDFSNYSLVNYALLYTEREGLYLRWYLNSFIILAIQVVSGLFFSSLVGYALGKYRFKGRNFLFILVLVVMMIPIEILILPLYKQMDAFRLINSYWGVVLPFVVPATGVFFFRQYTMGLPSELMESGRLDGCTEYGIYFRIMMPLMLNGLADDRVAYLRDADVAHRTSVPLDALWQQLRSAFERRRHERAADHGHFPA
jgi:arabinosaccharide transport system permease protein